MNTKKIWAGIFAGALLSAALSACLAPVGDGVGLDEDGNPLVPDTTVTFGQVQAIFTDRCITCHAAPSGFGYTGTGGAGNNGLDLTAGNSYAKLVNVATYEAPSTHPIWRVRPGSPDSSYLYLKVSGGPYKSGGKMPLTGAALTSSEIVKIRRWIAQGALP
jgi:hypothetical protein